MRHTLKNKQRSRVQAGFTFVEIVIIAPIVILAIGAFVAAVVSMTSEVLRSRASNVLTYNIQDALNHIEQDIKLSSTFLSQTNVDLTSPQGYDDSTSKYYNVDITTANKGNMLIMNALATTDNPLSSTSQIAYLSNQPNACGTDQSKNTPLSYNIIYYIKTVGSTSSLWRRTVMPSNYASSACNAVGSASPGIAAPWQVPSCTPDSYDPTSSFCKTNDLKLVDGVNPSDFTVTYYTSASSNLANSAATSLSGTDPDAAATSRQSALSGSTTAAVSISATQAISGDNINLSGNIRATRLDTNASSIIKPNTTETTPTAPAVTGTYNTPASVTFSWPIPSGNGNITYTAQYKLDGDATWTTVFTNSPLRTFTVTAPSNNRTVTASVTASTGGGTSSAGTASVSVPLWVNGVLENSWTEYAGVYDPARFTKTSEGVVVLSGLIKRSGSAVAGERLFQLPAGYRPALREMFTTITNPNVASRIDINSDGSVAIISGDAGYLSLDGIRFIPSTTTSIAFQPMTFSNSWVNNDGGSVYQVGSYAKDTLGRTFTRGLIKSGSTTSPNLIASLPSSPNYQSPSYLHLPTYGSSGFGFFSPAQTNSTYPGAGIQYKAGGNGYFSLSGMFYNTYTGFTSISVPTPTGWNWYSSAGIFSTPAYKKASDGIVTLKGLITGGTATSDTTMFTLPAGYRPAYRLIFEVANNNVAGRVDVLPTGEVRILTGGNTWLALDNISFVAEQ